MLLSKVAFCRYPAVSFFVLLGYNYLVKRKFTVGIKSDQRS